MYRCTGRTTFSLCGKKFLPKTPYRIKILRHNIRVYGRTKGNDFEKWITGRWPLTRWNTRKRTFMELKAIESALSLKILDLLGHGSRILLDSNCTSIDIKIYNILYCSYLKLYQPCQNDVILISIFHHCHVSSNIIFINLLYCFGNIYWCWYLCWITRSWYWLILWHLTWDITSWPTSFRHITQRLFRRSCRRCGCCSRCCCWNA